MFGPSQVVHRNQILATGISGRDLTELVRCGAVTRLWRGYYTTGQAIALPDPRGVTRSMRVVLSHQSAVAWLGSDLPEPVDALHVTAPRNRGRRSDAASGVRIHRADLCAADIVLVRGVRTTSAERTAIDVARVTPRRIALAVVDGMLRKRLTTLASLESSAQRLAAGPGRRSVVQTMRLADPRCGSVFESFARLLIHEAGLPRPCTQYTVRSPAGKWIGRVDFAWPEARVVLECDGFEHHSSRDAFVRDRRRWSALTRAGWRVAVVSWHDLVHDPAYVVGLVADSLGVPVTEPAHNRMAARAS